MSIFKKFATKTVDAVKEVASESTTEKLDVLGDIAKIGIFAFMAFTAVKGATSGHPSLPAPKRLPDFSQLVINNYYFKDIPGNSNRRAK